MISYEELISHRLKSYDLPKISALLAENGYSTIRFCDDWEAADFMAQHIDGKQVLRILLKGRLYFAKKYIGKGLHICFRDCDQWYVYPHDEMLSSIFDQIGIIANTKSWDEGVYHFPSLSVEIKKLLIPYRLS
nr:hypothetical protein [Acidithiobacillus montserratensis]